jgi:hypothetical protein
MELHNSPKQITQIVKFIYLHRLSYGPGQLKEPGRYRVRLLEIQISPDLKDKLDPKDLWTAPFPKDETTDAMARIVRQSPPIEGSILPPKK